MLFSTRYTQVGYSAWQNQIVSFDKLCYSDKLNAQGLINGMLGRNHFVSVTKLTFDTFGLRCVASFSLYFHTNFVIKLIKCKNMYQVSCNCHVLSENMLKIYFFYLKTC